MSEKNTIAIHKKGSSPLSLKDAFPLKIQSATSKTSLKAPAAISFRLDQGRNMHGAFYDHDLYRGQPILAVCAGSGNIGRRNKSCNRPLLLEHALYYS